MGTKMTKMEEGNGKKRACMEVFMTKDEPNMSPKLELLHVPCAKSKT